MHSRRRRYGFTFIEIMVVLVIVAVLMAVALPGYQGSMRKSARTAARTVLYDVVSRQEQYLMNNKFYAVTLADLGLPEPNAVDRSSKAVAGDSGDRVYRIELTQVSTTAFAVQATPQLRQTEDGCGTFTLKSDGSQLVSGVIGRLDCW